MTRRNLFITTDKYSSVYGGGGQTYVYHHEEDESSFRLVDTARVQKQPHHNKRIKYSQVSFWQNIGKGRNLSMVVNNMQQKIRRDREKREERRMGGKQQLAKGRLRER